jgi:hypothetical protein
MHVHDGPFPEALAKQHKHEIQTMVQIDCREKEEFTRPELHESC